MAGNLSDAVIVGSALARLLEDGGRAGAPARVAAFLGGLKRAMRAGAPARAG